MCYMEQTFTYNYMESIINIDWTNYLEESEMQSQVRSVYVSWMLRRSWRKADESFCVPARSTEIDDSKTMSFDAGKDPIDTFEISYSVLMIPSSGKTDYWTRIFRWAKFL